MDIQIPGVDEKEVMDQYEDDIELYAKVARSFIAVTPDVLNKLRLIENQPESTDALAKYAACIHGLKGASATVGAEETRKGALHLEKLAKSGDLQGVLAGNSTFLAQTEKLLDDMRGWIKQFDAK